MVVLETRYRAYPRSKYEYAFPSLGIWIVCAIIAGAASSAVTEAVMSDIEVPDPVMEWLVRISLLGLGMAGLALIHPTPTPRRPARGPSSYHYWTAHGMASQESDLDSINERLNVSRGT